MAFNLSQSLANIDPTVGKSELERIFEEEPVDLDTFIRDKKFLGQPDFVLSPIQRQFVMACERVYYPDLYPKMASEFNSSYWAQDIPVKNLFEIIWGKGCVSPESEVYSAEDGTWRPISEITGEHLVSGVIEVNPDGDTNHTDGQAALRSSEQVHTLRASQPFRRGHGRMLRVHTALGGHLDVYEGHLFLERGAFPSVLRKQPTATPHHWRAAGALKVGSRIAIANRLEIKSPVPRNPSEVELVGYWLGDGCMPSKKKARLHFAIDSSPRSKDLFDRYCELIRQYGCEPYIENMKSGALGITAVSGLRRNPLHNLVKELGLYGCLADTKRVPKDYFSLPDDQLKILLSAMWDTDGSLFWKSHSNGTKMPGFEYDTISEGLARDVQRLLLRFGVVGRLTNSYKTYTHNGEKKTGRLTWRVAINKASDIQRLARSLRLHGDKETLRQEFLKWSPPGMSTEFTEDISWVKVTKIEELGDGEYWDMNVPDGGSYVAGSSPIISSNSGKDGSCRIVSLRIAYLLMCMKSPQKYFGLPEFDSIHLLNIAANAPQANRAFFKPMTDAVRRGWFADKAEPKQGVIQYAKNIEAVSGHSDAEGQEGLNIILGVADEIDAFRTRDEKGSRGSREASTSAESIIAMIESSANSRFPETYKRVAISYPRYRGSMIQRLAEQGKESIRKHGEASVHFVSGPYATWEVNPRISGKEQFKEDYERDPLGSAAKYECKPSFSSDPYFRTPEIFRNSVTSDQSPLSISYVTEDHYSDYSGETTTVWEPRFHFDPGFRPIAGARYAIHTDLAIKGDRAGIAMSHISKWEVKTFTSTDEEGNVYEEEKTVPHVKTDFVGAFEADLTAKPPREIQIRWVRSLIEDLKKRGFYIALASFDGYQSEDSLQILTRRGVDTAKISADRTDLVWKTLRDVASDGRLSLPYNQLLLDELTALTIIRGKVDHPPKGSKDLADALACSIVGAIRCGGSEDSDGSGSMLNTGSDFTDSGLPADLPFGMTGGFGIPLGLEGMGF